MIIEKTLNLLDLYCIATTKCIEDGLILNRYGLRSFDLLIVSEAALSTQKSENYRLKHFNIINAFIYAPLSTSKIQPTMINNDSRYLTGLPSYSELKTITSNLLNKKTIHL